MAAGFSTVHHTIRDQGASAHGHGGVCVQVGPRLAPHTTRVGTGHSSPGCDSVWVRIDRRALSFGDRDLLIGAVYVSPLTSTVYLADQAGRSNGTAGEQANRAALVYEGHVQHMLDSVARPTDLVLLAGDFNAHTRGLDDAPCNTPNASLERMMGPLGAAIVGDIGSVPPRASSCGQPVNASGTALINMARANGLVILNGRVAGDESGAVTFPGSRAGSVIDLFLSPPAVWQRARSLAVHTHPITLSPAGRLPARAASDHRPVSLALDVLVRASTATHCRPPRGPKKAFDVKQWPAYSLLYDVRTRTKLDSISTDLASGAISTTLAAERLERLVQRLYTAALRPPPDMPKPPTPSHSDQPWWNDACASTHAALARARAAAAHGGPSAHALLVRARRAFNAARRAARAEALAVHNAAILSRRSTVPDIGWRLLNSVSARPRCPLETGWTQAMSQLYAPAPDAPTAAQPDAHRILFLINTPAPLPGSTSPPARFHSLPCTPEAWLSTPSVASRTAAAAALNAPITLSETCAAMQRLPNGKSPGPSRVPSEAWKYARESDPAHPDRPGSFILGNALHSLAGRIFDTGDYPDPFTVSTLTPLFKKGDPMNHSNYRGLAVGPPMAKLYASILTRRLSLWAKANGARHPSQAGFVTGLGPQHQHFLMRHLVTRYSRTAGPPLFICQIDFEKAFDKVPRDLMWERLRERGLHGPALQAFQASYRSVQLRVKVNGSLGDPFPSAQGVKQGDPSSPDLFGLYIETLADFMEAMDRHGLPVTAADGTILHPHVDDAPVLDGLVGPRRVVSALFADDINLVATSAARMNYLLAVLDIFCQAFGMRANISKCEALAFTSDPQLHAALSATPLWYRGSPIPPTVRARYLGLYYGPQQRGRSRASCPSPLFTDTHTELLASGQRATHALRSKLSTCGIRVPGLVMLFWNSCVRTVLSFGAQVWATSHLSCDFDAAMRHPMVLEQRRWLQRMVGSHRPPTLPLFMELSQLPLQHHWAGLIFRFWNDLVDDTSSLFHAAFRSDLRLALAAKCGWSWDVIKFVRELDLDSLPTHSQHTNDELVDYYSSLRLPVTELLATMAERLLRVWAHPAVPTVDTRSYTGPLPLPVCRYLQCMGLPAHRQQGDGTLESLPHIWLSLSRTSHTRLMQFRVGAWTILAANQPQHQRAVCDCICASCVRAGLGRFVEDERHVLMECPAYDGIRADFASVLPFGHGRMVDVLASDNQRALAECVERIYVCQQELHDDVHAETACDVCGGLDPEGMLLCDGDCARGFHCHCLTPALPRPPKGCWYCSDCEYVRLTNELT